MSIFVQTCEPVSLYDDELLLELRTIFVNENQNKLAEFTAALEIGDIRLAYLIIHTLKGCSAAIGEDALQAAASEAELAVNTGENRVTDAQIQNLKTELNKTLFALTPLKNRTVPKLPTPASALKSSPGNMNRNSILIVDDEKSNIVTLKYILAEKYTIYTAQNGEIAIKTALEKMPDLILLDIFLPDMSGYSVLAALKELEATREIPIIFITGYTSAEEEEKALSYNAVDYISKPLRPNIVRLRVRSQIRIINQIRTIERLSMTDQLTEIPNRRSFDTRLNTEWRRAIREKTTISLLMLDVDKFKTYNDVYEHQQGDIVLKTVAKTIENDLKRPGDSVARWGGEEFVALLANTDINGAVEVAERIRINIEHLHITHEKCLGAIPITISIGVTSKVPTKESSLPKFISTADNALYRAKAAGRNRVCRAWD